MIQAVSRRSFRPTGAAQAPRGLFPAAQHRERRDRAEGTKDVRTWTHGGRRPGWGPWVCRTRDGSTRPTLQPTVGRTFPVPGGVPAAGRQGRGAGAHDAVSRACATTPDAQAQQASQRVNTQTCGRVTGPDAGAEGAPSPRTLPNLVLLLSPPAGPPEPHPL